ncbi:thiol reductant ABC exporter subunit CydD [Roseomonas sp. HJA6]|uniref:Thiol reductant ABC exporter subunit CydD n=1 Tax=Roseomonas alba TaxID=2846776 RepID=A0ABS7AH44_9PROT|nr:thiol reductant ABC exporter subunit CydD [Neoroseomonas alba]MBW6401620.1 thiol reductant ABC exporter subunit CydD [Neoroseomonas alba]
MSDGPAPPHRTFVSGLSSGAWLQTIAALVWIPQAALLALVVDGIARGEGAAAAVLPAFGIVALGALRTAVDAVGSRRLFRAARASLTGLRRDAVASLAARSPLDAGRPASGAAAAAVCEQAEAVLPYLLRYRAARLRVTVVPPVLLLAVLTQSWLAALILLVAAPLIPLFMALIGLRAKVASEAQMLEIGSMNGLLLDRLRGLPTIRAYDAVDATARRLRAAAEALRTRSMAVLRIAFLSSAVLELFASLGVAMVAVYVGFHLLGTLGFGAWGGTMSLGAGLFVLLLAPAFFEPLRDLAAAWHDRAAGEAAQAALRDLAAPPELALPDALTAVPPMLASAAPGLMAKDLVFRYPGAARPIFNGFALQVAAGERVALLGASGAGKSTLLAVLAGLALPEAGTIHIGETPLTPDSAARLRCRIAWLGQNPALFAGSLRANILLGRRDLNAEAVRRILLPGLPMTRPVGEDGAGLSGGEALRLGLARAIVAPEATLILADEPTAHLDADTAADVIHALLAAAEGRTLVVATHDPVLAAHMDRVVQLS